MKECTVLVVDDEPDIRELLSMTIERMGLRCEAADCLTKGKALVEKRDYSLILTDMRMPDGDGIDLVKYVQANKPHIPVAVITAFGNVEGAVNTLKAGAFDYVSKPIHVGMLKDLVHTALSMGQINKPSGSIDLIGSSEPMVLLKETIEKLARSQAPVFIQGESGVGKEKVAQLIHILGPRCDKPFIPVNCGAIPSELMESEFFGHKKGSFTGAVEDKEGLFLAAQGGTLFLDEIAELPITMQVKLLRAIQEKAIKPIGCQKEIPVDVRILSASHKDLQTEITQGTFRKDLYYRVNVIELNVPPLRDRSEDVTPLVQHFLHEIKESHGIGLPSISKPALKALKSYAFPGNVRELENILERAVVLCENNCIEVDDLGLTSMPAQISSEADISSLTDSLTEHEKEMILEALDQTKWNRTAAAKLLGVSFRTLRYRLKKLGIE